MKFLVTLLVAVSVAGCSSRETSQLIGEWTPASINDCSADGTTITVNSSGLTYRSGKSELQLIKISAFRDHGSETEIDGQFRIYRPTDNVFWHPETTMRFEIEADRAQLLGEVSEDGALIPSDRRIVEELTLRRCP